MFFIYLWVLHDERRLGNDLILKELSDKRIQQPRRGLGRRAHHLQLRALLGQPRNGLYIQ